MKSETAAIVIVAILLVIALVATGYQWYECSTRGGTLVRGIVGVECLR